jgi:hypothetical protein
VYKSRDFIKLEKNGTSHRHICKYKIAPRILNFIVIIVPEIYNDDKKNIKMSKFIRLGSYVAIHPKHNILIEYKPREFMCKITMPITFSITTPQETTTYYIKCETMLYFDTLVRE